jgi:hypothetical protein
MSKANAQLQLLIELQHTDPVVWRRVLVPDTITLVKLHQVIQESMGWYDCHLHEFIIGRDHYGIVDADDLMWEMQPPLLNEKRKKLLTVLGRKKRFEYLYDYGDSWWHTITVENYLALSPYPLICCVGASMACPPEDVGGIGGYYELIDIMADLNHEEHESMIEWCGKRFDPTEIDILEINRRYNRIKL